MKVLLVLLMAIIATYVQCNEATMTSKMDRKSMKNQITEEHAPKLENGKNF